MTPDHSADEPTEEMLEAGFAACKFWIGDDKYEQMVRGDLDWPNVEPGLVAAYKAMRAARPEAQAAPKLTEEQTTAPICPFCTQSLDARVEAIRECIAVARNIAAPFPSPTADEILTALVSLHAQAGVSGDEQRTGHSGSASQRARSPE